MQSKNACEATLQFIHTEICETKSVYKSKYRIKINVKKKK